MRIKKMAESADNEKSPDPEWISWLEIDDLEKGKPSDIKITANEEVRKNLARRLNLVRLPFLQAEFTAKRENSRVIHVAGRLQAKVEQTCVTTLAPVISEIEDEFESWFADPDQAVSFARARHEREKSRNESEIPMLEEYEDPEPVIDGKINLGELAAQFLSLAIDPYPHAAGALSDFDEEARQTPNNPFEKLKDLKKP